MKTVLTFALLALALGFNPSAWAYGGGGGGGGASCAEAKFYDESPVRSAEIASLSEIAVVASDNTDIATLEFEVNGQRMKPDVSTRRSGEFDLKVRLPEPITQPGKVRVTLAAKSKEGCSAFQPYYYLIVAK